MKLIYDRRSKRLLEQILDPWGQVSLEFVVSAPDDQRFDLWFEPNRDAPSWVPSFLLLMRRIACCRCAIELFSRRC